MNKKPAYFIILSAILLLIVLGMPFQVMWLYEHPYRDLDLAIAQLPWNNWALMLAATVVSIQLFLVHPNLKFSVPVFCFLGFLNNFFVGLESPDYSLIETSTASLVLVLIFVPLLHPEQMKLLNDSSLRWWTRPPRAELLIPAQIKTKHNQIHAQTYDLSESGVFLTFGSLDLFKEQFETELSDFESFEINLKLDQLQVFRCQTQIVRINNDQRGVYPPGVGLKFVNPSESQRQELRKFVARQTEQQIN